MIKFNDVTVAEEYAAHKASHLWPNYVIDFYEARLTWQRGPDGFDGAELQENIEDTDGIPQQIQCTLGFCYDKRKCF